MSCCTQTDADSTTECMCQSSTPGAVGGAKTHWSARPDPSQEGSEYTSYLWCVAPFLSNTCMPLYLYADACRTTLFSQSWLCTTCGCELCGICVKDGVASSFPRCSICKSHIFCQPFLPANQCSHTLSPISRFQDDELRDLIQAMESCIIRSAISNTFLTYQV
jgi:hypothetical protein